MASICSWLCRATRVGKHPWHFLPAVAGTSTWRRCISTRTPAAADSAASWPAMSTDNEFLLSGSNKILVGYPVDGIAASYQGRMHATPAADVAFGHGGSAHTYITTGIHSSGGASGGPLCVQFEGGNYYPAAIYLGGSGQTVVRSIDSGVIDLFNRAEVSGNGGDNNTGGGITHTSVTGILDSTKRVIKVTIEPAGARIGGAAWRRLPADTYHESGNQVGEFDRRHLYPGIHHRAGLSNTGPASGGGHRRANQGLYLHLCGEHRPTGDHQRELGGGPARTSAELSDHGQPVADLVFADRQPARRSHVRCQHRSDQRHAAGGRGFQRDGGSHQRRRQRTMRHCSSPASPPFPTKTPRFR